MTDRSVMWYVRAMSTLDTPTGPIAYDEQVRGLVIVDGGGFAGRPPHVRAFCALMARPGFLRAVSELWRGFASPEHDLREQAPQIAAPTLVIWGRRDPVIPVKVGRRIAATIPGAQLVVLDSGHVPHTTDPDGFAAQLIPFAEAAFASAGARLSAG
jgi:pimeloyl-ACP methyl ester carboxylesterase